MSSSRCWSHRLVLGTLFLLALLHQVSASVEYCSSFNTANTNKNSSIYQSNGLCHDFCISSYAFAIVQADGCWCSNYAPSTTTSGCTEKCPGFPDEICGGNGVYGYIALVNSPAGTEGPSSPTSSSAAATTPQATTVTETPDAVTVVSTIVPTSSSLSSSPKSSSTTPPPTTSSSNPPSSSSSTWTPTPVISLETITGQVRTVTVTPTVPPNSQNLTPPAVTKKSSGGLGTGGAVGLTIGLVAVVGIISALIYFFLKRRREVKQEEEYNDISRRGSSAGLGGPIPSRSMSENSRYVLGTDGRQVVEAWEADRDTPGSRRSRLMPVDPRLDPFSPVYQRGENKSRESVNTIRDDHDYSRRINQTGPILRATNPDE